MGHSLEVKERAFQLYVQGLAFDEIARELDRSKMHVNRKTLIRWKKTEGWEVRKAAVVGQVQEKNDSFAAETLADLVKTTAGLQKRVTELLKEAGAPRSLEGGVTAYVQLTRLLREMAPARTVEGDAGAIIETVVKAITSYPRIRAVWEQDSEKIMELVRQAMKKHEAGQD